jgi:hypothetical protein
MRVLLKKSCLSKEINKMKTIDPKAIVEAYKVTGIEPMFEDWGYQRLDTKKYCGCALTAFSASQSKYIDAFYQRAQEAYGGIGIGFIEKTLNGEYTNSYLWGFVNGYDDIPASSPPEYVAEEYMAGHKDGSEARALVIAEYGTSIHNYGTEPEDEDDDWDSDDDFEGVW